MSLIEYFHEHWFIALCALYLAYFFLFGLFVKLPNRVLRSMTIRKNGWPPAHCDADGDFKDEK